MVYCAYCGSSIIWGGVGNADCRYCNANCQEQAVYVALTQQVLGEELDEIVRSVHEGDCPNCGGPGPIDSHLSYRVWSALVLTFWSDHEDVCCRSCAVKNKLISIVFCGALGWWSLPLGPIATPIQIGRNVLTLFSGPDPSRPSSRLRRLMLLMLAAKYSREAKERYTHAEEISEFVEE